MNALAYIVHTVLGLYLATILLRVLLQWRRAGFNNPIGRAILQVTNPLVIPLRRVLPAAGRLDTASFVLILGVALLSVALGSLILGFGLPAPLWRWLVLAVLEIVRTLLLTYLYAVLFYGLQSMIAGGMPTPWSAALAPLCEPILRRVRAIIPPIGALDLSPLWVIIAIQALLLLLP